MADSDYLTVGLIVTAVITVANLLLFLALPVLVAKIQQKLGKS